MTSNTESREVFDCIMVKAFNDTVDELDTVTPEALEDEARFVKAVTNDAPAESGLAILAHGFYWGVAQGLQIALNMDTMAKGVGT